jgi:hypothetical protein
MLTVNNVANFWGTFPFRRTRKRERPEARHPADAIAMQSAYVSCLSPKVDSKKKDVAARKKAKMVQKKRRKDC